MANDAKKENPVEERDAQKRSEMTEKLTSIVRKISEVFSEANEFIKGADTVHLAMLGITVLTEATDLQDKIDLLMSRDPKVQEVKERLAAKKEAKKEK